MRYLVFIMIVAGGCSSNNSIPPGIIPADKMETLVWDLLKADEVINIKFQADSSINKIDTSYLLYSTIFQIHEVSEEEFKRSFEFYRSRPELLKPVLDSLQQRATFPPQLRRLKKAAIQ